MSEKKMKSLGVTPLARIVSYAEAEVDPMNFTVAPSEAIKLALSKAKLKASDIDFFEINEAFATTAIVNMKLLGVNAEKVNVNGGAISLGHPLGLVLDFIKLFNLLG